MPGVSIALGTEAQSLEPVLPRMWLVTGDRSLLPFDPQLPSSIRGLEEIGLSGCPWRICLKYQVPRPHSQRFLSGRCGVGPKPAF